MIVIPRLYSDLLFFCFFNDTATTEIYTSCHTLSLHDALPISEAQLFDRDYKAIPDTDPQQLMAGCVALTDEVLPPIQEPALQFDERVVFYEIGRAHV